MNEAIQTKEASPLENRIKTNALKKFFQRPLIKSIASSALPGLYCYAVIFILGEILMSGGKSDRNPYTIIALVIFLIASQIVFIKREKYSSYKEILLSAITVTLVFAILDYLIVNLFLMKNNYEIYKYWPNYFIYLTTLALPYIRSSSDKIKADKVRSLLTKQERTL
ncbi:MAG: hypothetical protein ABH810_03290 [bacterium]